MDIVAPLSYLSLRTRLPKIAECYEGDGYRVGFVGWRRDPADVSKDLDQLRPVHHILRGGGYSTRILPVYYLLWMLTVLIWCLIARPSRVHALGFETAFPVAVIKRFRPALELVFDDADRFSQSFPMPALARVTVARFERWTGRTANVHVVPNVDRYDDGLSGRAVVVPNVPSEDVVRRARALPVKRLTGTGMIIYMNGWLGESRGARIVADAATSLPELQFVVAGRVADMAAERLIALGNVRYLGVLANDEALAQYRAVDIAITFYDPVLRINRLAEANKWGDCLVTGTPFIVNQEVETARSYVRTGAAVAVPFHDVQELTRTLRALDRDRDRLADMAAAMRSRGHDVDGFETVFAREVLTKLQEVK